MNNIYQANKEQINKCIKEIWNYMYLNQNIEKCDLIIGCGCANLEIPVKCSNLYKAGYAPKILFAGGFGKITKDIFHKSEAEIYKDIATKNGVPEKDIIVETKSTNTGDNFRFALEILKKNNIKHDKILIVHKPLSERRTLSTAKTIFTNQELLITSIDLSFEEYIKQLENSSDEEFMNHISVMVGDIQRMIVYPQFGWQTINEIPKYILDDYYYLKGLGFSKYIMSKEDIKVLIDKYGIITEKEIYFY